MAISASCPFAQCFSVQIGDAMFGHDVVHVAARRHDARAGLKHRHNARHIAAASQWKEAR